MQDREQPSGEPEGAAIIFADAAEALVEARQLVGGMLIEKT